MPHAFSTQRLTLRPLGPQDAPSIARFVGDLDVARWLTRVPHPYGIEDAHAFIERSAGDEFTYAVIAQSTFAGVMSITDELGYWLGQPFWGRGYATEAAKTVAGIVSDALVTADLSLERGRLVALHFDRARAAREGTGDLRRIDLTFRARVEDTGVTP